jgi:hypothetical protein
MLLYGLGMIVVILFGEYSIGSKMVGTFGSMFAGLLGLGSGYILGRQEGESKKNGKEDAHVRT